MLENSLTSEKRMLRTTLQHSLENVATQRSKFRQKDIRLFEVGKTYYVEDGKYVEERVLGCITSGAHTYAEIKGDCETLLNRLGYAYSADYVTIVPLSESSYFASIALETIVEKGPSYSSKLLSNPIQFIYHDFALVVPIGTDVETLLSKIKELDPIIYATEYISTQDVGQEGKNEYLIRVSYGSAENTLSEKDVQPVREKILKYTQTL